MFRIILTAAALTLTGPAFAASQLETLLGVSPNVYTSAELAKMHFATGDTDPAPRLRPTQGALVISTHGPDATSGAAVDTLAPASSTRLLN